MPASGRFEAFYFTTWRYALAVILGIGAERFGDLLKMFVRGVHDKSFYWDFESVVVILAFNIFLVACIVGAAWLVEKLVHTRFQKIVFIVSILLTGFYYPAPC